jgi:hypothetical protein
LILPSAMSRWRAWTAWLAAILRLVLVRVFNLFSFQARAFYTANGPEGLMISTQKPRGHQNMNSRAPLTRLALGGHNRRWVC